MGSFKLAALRTFHQSRSIQFPNVGTSGIFSCVRAFSLGYRHCQHLLTELKVGRNLPQSISSLGSPSGDPPDAQNSRISLHSGFFRTEAQALAIRLAQEFCGQFQQNIFPQQIVQLDALVFHQKKRVVFLIV